MKRTLRVLVLVEIAFGLSSIIVDWYAKRFLPDALQGFLNQTQESDITAREWALLALGFGDLVLGIVAWVAVWRFGISPRARLLYTLAWGISIPLTAVWGPYVYSGIGLALGTATAVTAGMILGILHFANLAGPSATTL